MLKKSKIPVMVLLMFMTAMAFQMSTLSFPNDPDARIYVDIRDFGAKGDGLTDDSSAIQKAIDEARKTSGTVVIPGGLYRMKSGVKVPKGVSITGSLGATTGPWQDYLDAADKGATRVFGNSPGALWASAEYIHGSWILADNGLGDANSDPTFLLDGNTSISGLGFITSSMAPVTSSFNFSPPVIGVYADEISSGATAGITIDNISLSNCYYGIAVVSGSDVTNQYVGKSGGNANIGKVTISNIMGAPMNRGIIIKGISSPVEMSNLQFNYSCYISEHVNMRMQMAVDVDISASSNVKIDNMLTFGAYSGLTTRPAYASRHVGLEAYNLNLEGQKAISLLSSGDYDIYNSYFFMVNFAEAATQKAFRGIEIKQDPGSSNASRYSFTNCVVQNPVAFSQSNNAQWEDHSIDIDVGGSADLDFSNIQLWGRDAENVEALIKYTRRSGSNTSVLFENINFVTEFSNPLISLNGSGIADGEITFKYCRFSQSAGLPSGSKVRFIDCTRYSTNNSNTVFNSAG